MIKNTGLDRLYLQIKDRLNEAYHEINLSGEPIDGKYCKSVEDKLKQITGRKHARVTTSGTSAIQTALIAWKIKNKKVACTNYSFVASANQAAYNNDVDFIEIDSNGLMKYSPKYNTILKKISSFWRKHAKRRLFLDKKKWHLKSLEF